MSQGSSPSSRSRRRPPCALGSDFWHTARSSASACPLIMVADGPHGAAQAAGGGRPRRAGGSDPATCFPTASALASTWDLDLLERVGEALGERPRPRGGVLLGPGVNIKRSPLCGRNFEYFSEDPLLRRARLGAWCRACRARASAPRSSTSPPTTRRPTGCGSAPTSTSARCARSTCRPSSGSSRAQPWTVMCAYNRVNGTHASRAPAGCSPTVLRDEWGFEGLVVSDWGAVHDRVGRGRRRLDLEMPPHLGAERRRARRRRSRRATWTRRCSTPRRAGCCASSTACRPARPGTSDFDADAHHALAREAARPAVLLKNDGGLLPPGPPRPPSP